MSAVEFVLLLKTQQVCLFQIPPLTTSKGYYLDDWKQMFWEGGCKLTEKAGLLTLYFIDKNTQAVQTLVQMPDNPYEAIQKTIDSSRGYAVRLVTPNGSFQWVGCVFRDRNDAFDFNAKITDFIERREMERNPTKFKNEFQPTQDFSLKQGEKLQINLSIDGQAKKQTTEKSGQSNLSDFTFAPPPDFNDFAQFSVPVQKSTTQEMKNEFSGWSDWGQPQQKPQQQQPAFQQAFQQQQQQQQPFQQQQQQAGNNKTKNEVNLLDL